MQTRRSTGLTPLTIVLPHPPLPHRRSSLLSLNSAASPHTPRSCASPSLYCPTKRKSTDSWNSSNADDMDFEWKSDQVLLLARTLDALPAHLVTPFNGPIPPSNLLDKIARGVSQAKGPVDWPHSIRATRVKLLELARARAKEEALAEQRRQVIREEVEIDDGSSYSYFHDGEEKPVGVGPRRPLYRQSSMDFIKPTPVDIKDNASIARLSNRLQRTDRIFPNPSYHPYSRTTRRSSSPPHPADVPPLINPSTPSSSTLNSLSSLSSSVPRLLHRSVSTISSGSLFSSSSVGMPLPDPRLQRVRRSDSLCSGPPAPPPKDHHTPTSGFKRAPSYGALAQEVRQERSPAMSGNHKHVRQVSGSYPSSDEEEKVRTRRAKKMRTKTGGASPSTPSVVSSPPSSAPPSPMIVTAPSSPVAILSKPPVPPAKDKASPKAKPKGVAFGTEDRSYKPSSIVKKGTHNKSSSSSSNKAGKSETGKLENNKATHHPSTRPAMNLQRNPSMFGPELPHLRNNNADLTSPKLRSPSPILRDLSPAYGIGVPPSPPLMASPMLLSSPTSPKVKTLRRVRRLAPARRISFGSLAASGNAADADVEGEGMDLSGNGGKAPLGLGSAFQLL